MVGTSRYRSKSDMFPQPVKTTYREKHMELTITQNGALYFAHHKLPKPRASLFLPLRRRRAPKRQSAESGGGRRRKELGWGKTELGARRKSDPDKVALARDL